MKKTLRLITGEEYTLAPIAYEEFCLTSLWRGASDVEWDAFLRDNGYRELSEFADIIRGATIRVEGFNNKGDCL